MRQQTLVFDLGGVVFNWQPLLLLREIFPDRAFDDDSARQMLAGVFQSHDTDGDWAQWDLGLVTPADLARQRQSILDRIGRLGAAARVLPFPAAPPAASRQAPPAADRRWVLAAAAAGIILGIGVGRLPGGSPVTPSLAPSGTARLAAAEPAIDPRRDDRLLSDVEEMLTREIRPEFEALDGLTPITYEAR